MSEAIAEVPTLGPRPDAEGTPIGELDLMRPDLFHDDYHVLCSSVCVMKRR